MHCLPGPKLYDNDRSIRGISLCSPFHLNSMKTDFTINASKLASCTKYYAVLPAVINDFINGLLARSILEEYDTEFGIDLFIFALTGKHPI